MASLTLLIVGRLVDFPIDENVGDPFQARPAFLNWSLVVQQEHDGLAVGCFGRAKQGADLHAVVGSKTDIAYGIYPAGAFGNLRPRYAHTIIVRIATGGQ